MEIWMAARSSGKGRSKVASRGVCGGGLGRFWAGGGVVEAEVLVAEAFGAATVAGGEDVAAVVGFGFDGGLHGVYPPRGGEIERYGNKGVRFGLGCETGSRRWCVPGSLRAGFDEDESRGLKPRVLDGPGNVRAKARTYLRSKGP